jgi:hypothetical protein
MAWIGLLVAGTVSGGCLPNNFLLPTSADKDKPEVMSSDGGRFVYRQPVTAGQVNGNNAQEKVQALRDELDQDMQRTIEASDAKGTKRE